MNHNIVCFGPTNSGKSTLAGYLYSHGLKNEEYERKVQQFRNDYGNNFQERRILSYFVDTGKDEYNVRRRASKKGTGSVPGTSMRKHVTLARLENGLNCTLIDTPGTDNRWRNGFQGIYMGDIGVFVIEINTLSELFTNYIIGSDNYERCLDKLLLPISLWEKYGRIERLIIVISKIDLCGYSEYTLARAVKALKKRAILNNVYIIPIAINVKERSDYNIFSKPENFSYPNLIDTIKKLLDSTIPIDKPLKRNRIFANVDKLFDRTRMTGEPALRIKVIDGHIKEGDSVLLGPVKYKNQVCNLEGSVKTLMFEADQRLVTILDRNHIGGVVFSQLKNGRDILSLKDIKLLNTTLIMDSNCLYSSGNYLVFSIREDSVSKDLFKDGVLNEDIKLIWFGKNEILRIISVTKKSGCYQFCLMNTKEDTYPFYFQRDTEGNIIYRDYVLQYKDKFIRASLNSITTISSVHRKNVRIILKTDYQERLSKNKMGELYYVKENDQTVYNVRNISGLELVDVLYKENIQKSDIVNVEICKNGRSDS